MNQEYSVALLNQYMQYKQSSEKSRLVTLEDLKSDPDFFVYKQKEMPLNRPRGMTLGSSYDENGDLCVLETKSLSHALILGATGTGKTQGFMMSSVLNAHPDTSYVIFDPKGEIFHATYHYSVHKFGKKNVRILNFQQPKKGTDFYNYLALLAQRYYEAKERNDENTPREVEKVWADLSKYIKGLFRIRTNNDTSWDEGARMFLQGLCAGLIEDTCYTAAKKGLRRRLRPQEVSLCTAAKIFSQFSWKSNGDRQFFSSRDEDSQAKKLAHSVISVEANNTISCYLSLVTTYLEPYFNPKIQEALRYHTINCATLGRQPQILYIVYDMGDAGMLDLLNGVVISMLEQLLEYSHQQVKPLDVPVCFLCDEFASLQANPVYPKIFAVGRGSNIYLSIVIQSYAQLETRYREEFHAIKENCNYKIFLGSNDRESCMSFINEMGTHTVIDEKGLLNGIVSYAEENLITLDEALHGMKEGAAYITVFRHQPISTQFCFQYRTPEYLTEAPGNYDELEPYVDLREETFEEDSFDLNTPDLAKTLSAQERKFYWEHLKALPIPRRMLNTECKDDEQAIAMLTILEKKGIIKVGSNIITYVAEDLTQEEFNTRIREAMDEDNENEENLVYKEEDGIRYLLSDLVDKDLEEWSQKRHFCEKLTWECDFFEMALQGKDTSAVSLPENPSEAQKNIRQDAEKIAVLVRDICSKTGIPWQEVDAIQKSVRDLYWVVKEKAVFPIKDTESSAEIMWTLSESLIRVYENGVVACLYRKLRQNRSKGVFFLDALASQFHLILKKSSDGFETKVDKNESLIANTFLLAFFCKLCEDMNKKDYSQELIDILLQLLVQ